MDTYFGHGSTSKKRRISCGNVSYSESYGSIETRTGSLFKHLHLSSQWVEPGTKTRCLSLAIFLPCGVGSGDFSVHVVDGGLEIELCVTWPRGLRDLKSMHKKWLNGLGPTRLEFYLPKFIELETVLKSYRSHVS